MSTGAPQGGRVDGLAPDCSLGEPVLGVTGLSPRVSDVEEIFMQESDALNFLKKRSKRSPRFQDEVNGKTLWPAFCSCSFSLPSPLIFFLRCDRGFGGAYCVPVIPLPSILKDDFNGNLHPDLWPEVYGAERGNLNGETIKSGTSLIFKGVR